MVVVLPVDIFNWDSFARVQGKERTNILHRGTLQDKSEGSHLAQYSLA